MQIDDFPEKIKLYVLNPLLEIETSDRKELDEEINKYLKDNFLTNKKNFYDLILENLDWFLDLQNKAHINCFFQQKFPDYYKIYFYEIHDILKIIIRNALEDNYFQDSEIIYKLNDIFLESDHRRHYFYNIKLYHSKESIIDLKDRIERIFNKFMRISPQKIPHDFVYEGFPRWIEFRYGILDGSYFHINFIENDPDIPHNNLYIDIFLSNRLKNLWKDIPKKDYNRIKSILKEIIKNRNIQLKNIYNLPEDIIDEINEVLAMKEDYKLEVFKSDFTTKKGLIFVLMPFEDKLDQVYKEFIKKPLKKKGYEVKRADDFFKPHPIIKDIWKSINEAEIIIADLTGRNPNVFYELGLAHLLGKYSILITQNLNDVPFDLKSIRIIEYKYEPEGFKKLKEDVKNAIDAKYNNE